MTTAFARDANEAARQDAAAQVRLDLALHEPGVRATALLSTGTERREVVLQRMSLFAITIGALSAVFSPGCRGKKQAQQEPVRSEESAAKEKASQPTTAPEPVLARHRPNVDLPEFPFAPGTILVDKEGYEMHEVLFLRWGNGPNEIRMGQEAEYKWGPSRLLDDYQQNVYFDVPGGRGVVKYNLPEKSITILNVRGFPLGVTPEGDLLVNSGTGTSVLSPDGTIKDTFHLGLRESPEEIIHDVKGRTYVCSGAQTFEIVGFEDRTTKDNTKLKYAVFRERYGVYPARFSDRLYAYTSAESADKPRIRVWSKGGGDETETPLQDEDVFGDFRLHFVDVVGDDSEDNIYFHGGLCEKRYWGCPEGSAIVQKYNKHMELLLAVAVFENAPGIDTHARISVNGEGDIIQLYTTEEGVKIVMWSR